MIEEELKKFIPAFLPNGEQDELFFNLKQLVSGETTDRLKNFYSTHGTKKEPYIDQGDGINMLPIFNLPAAASQAGKGFIISNSCDVNPENDRNIPMRILYAPVLDLEKYEQALKQQGVYSGEWAKAVRSQQVTHLFYLPKGKGMTYEAIVPLDHIHSIPETDITPDKISSDRIFQLSLSAWYALLIKLTHHFARTTNDLILNRSPVNNP